MKYFSEKTKKIYDSTEELQNDEIAFEEKNNETLRLKARQEELLLKRKEIDKEYAENAKKLNSKLNPFEFFFL